MFYLLVIGTAIFFLAHVALLFASFSQSKLVPTRYFYSHLTLWITGIFVLALAILYSGTGRSSFLDYFDNNTKKAMILVFTFALSLVAHIIVKQVILRLLRKNP